MYRWYKLSHVCCAYLADVPTSAATWENPGHADEESMKNGSWRRGYSEV